MCGLFVLLLLSVEGERGRVVLGHSLEFIRSACNSRSCVVEVKALGAESRSV